jgi:hypothetical protein
MKKTLSIITLLCVGLAQSSVQAETPGASELLLIQQSVNTQCLARGQGRARMLCRCAAVLVSNKLAAEGTAGYQENAEAIFEQAFEFCMSSEDRAFTTSTAKLYQSQPAAEESLRKSAVKP